MSRWTTTLFLAVSLLVGAVFGWWFSRETALSSGDSDLVRACELLDGALETSGQLQDPQTARLGAAAWLLQAHALSAGTEDEVFPFAFDLEASLSVDDQATIREAAADASSLC